LEYVVVICFGHDESTKIEEQRHELRNFSINAPIEERTHNIFLRIVSIRIFLGRSSPWLFTANTPLDPIRTIRSIRGSNIFSAALCFAPHSAFQSSRASKNAASIPSAM
jgi:hypothetical protein